MESPCEARRFSPAWPRLKDKKPGPARAENLSLCPVLVHACLWQRDHTLTTETHDC